MLVGTLERLVVFRESLEHTISFGGEDFARWPLRDDASFFEADDIGVEQQGFIHIMSDGEHRNFACVEPCAHARQQLVAQGAVKAGKGFVQKHEVGIGDGEGAGQGDAAAFATRELGWHAVGEALQMEEIHHLIDHGRIFGLRQGNLRGEADVPFGGEVGKERGVLGCVGQSA